jgi:hypothetical protein
VKNLFLILSLFSFGLFGQTLRYDVISYGTDSVMTPCEGYIEFKLKKRKTDYISHVGVVTVKTPHYDIQDSVMGVFTIDWKGRVGFVDAAVISNGFRFIMLDNYWGFFEPINLQANMFYETKKRKRKL